jgi:hypothetical protein
MRILAQACDPAVPYFSAAVSCKGVVFDAGN